MSRASVTCLLGMELGVVFSLVSRASVTCLLGMEQGAYGGVHGDGAVDGFIRGFSAVFALFRVVSELSASFWSPR